MMTTTKPPRSGGKGSTPPVDKTGSKDEAKQASTDAMSENDGLDLPPIGAVTALRIVGRNVELPLPTKKYISLGSSPEPEVDLSVSSVRGDKQQHVSKLHVVIQRKGTHLWIVDQSSSNGTFVKDRRETEFARSAGESFRVGDVTLLALDEQLRALRPTLQWLLGLNAHDHIDEVLGLAAHGDPLLLIGPDGCGQRILAEAIHRASARSHKAFVLINPPLATEPEWGPVLAYATAGTAFLDLSVVPKPSAPFVNELFGTTYKTRQIIAAPDLRAAGERLGTQRLPRLHVVPLPPLSSRRAEIPRLFDLLFRRAGSKLGIAKLGDENVAALCGRDWHENLDELAHAAPRLLAVLEHDMNITAAAEALPDTTRQALSKWLSRLGLRFKSRDSQGDHDD